MGTTPGAGVAGRPGPAGTLSWRSGSERSPRKAGGPTERPGCTRSRESFFATLRTKLLDRSYWATRLGRTTAIFSRIEGFYNRKRRRSTLGHLNPKEYESVALNSKSTTEPAESLMVAS